MKYFKVFDLLIRRDPSFYVGSLGNNYFGWERDADQISYPRKYKSLTDSEYMKTDFFDLVEQGWRLPDKKEFRLIASLAELGIGALEWKEDEERLEGLGTWNNVPEYWVRDKGEIVSAFRANPPFKQDWGFEENPLQATAFIRLVKNN